MNKKAKNIKEVLRDILTEEELKEVVGSFDIIGDIAITEIAPSLISKEKKIAEAITQVHKHIKVVAKKQSAMQGEYRTRKLKIIFGENRTETLHKENNVEMLMDIAKVYFSPRLSYERKRIAEQVRDNEKILALFAGIGPFPLVIAKNNKKCEITAIELNPVGVEYMKKNIALNKIKNIDVIYGDVAEIIPKNYSDYADRIIMPLPKGGEAFLKTACIGAKNNAIIHFYTFADVKDPFAQAHEKIFSCLGKKNVEIVFERVVRPFSPGIVQIVIDFKNKKQ